MMRILTVLSLASALVAPTRRLTPKICRAAPDELATQDDDGWTVTLSGLKYQDLVEGTGATASSGKVAVVSGIPYWYSEARGESTWDPPEGWAQEATGADLTTV